MSNVPVWFLDVDGVLNAITRKKAPDFMRGQATPTPSDPFKYTITWHPDIIRRINSLIDEGVVDVRWLTTWGSAANHELRELIGINELEVAGEPPLYAAGGYVGPNSAPGGWWKFTVVRDFRENNPDTPIIWTDDDLRHEREASEWVTQDGNTLAVAPDERHALLMTDLDKIEAFVRSDDE